MYRFLGSTEILMYDFINYISAVALLFINFLYYKKKLNSLGRLSLNLSESFSKRHKYPHIKTVFVIIEILLVSFFQYYLGTGFNRAFGILVGTGANYFATLFVSPVLVASLCFFLGINLFKQLDMITPAYAFVMIFVRLACFCDGCCNGIPCSFGLYNHYTKQVEFPIQLLEMSLAFAIFVFLVFRQKKAKEGTMFPTYVIAYSSTRFFAEFLGSSEKVLSILNTYQILCLIGILLGIFYLFIVNKYKSKILLFCDNYFDAVEDLYYDIKQNSCKKRKTQAIRHSSKKTKQGKRSPNIRHNKNTSDMKKWILIWSLGLMGQTGWNIESTWFSTYIYEKIDKSPAIMTPMLFLGAFATTLAVFLFGTVSDRTGKRRTMISTGFIIWGALSICFSFTQYLPKINLSLAAVCVVIIDMLISFFAGMSVSVGFSTWITDNMSKLDVGKLGGAIAAQSVLGSLLANVVGGALIGKSNNYIRLFVVSGIILIFVGWLSTFLFDSKDDVQPFVRNSFFKQFSELFDFRNILKQKELVWVNITITVFFLGFSSYFPHLGNFLTQYLGYSADQMGLISAIPMVLAMFITLPISKLVNKNKFVTVTLVSIVSGLLGSYFISNVSPETINVSRAFNLQLFIAVFFASSSYIIMIQATKTWTKNLYPKESKGQYEGLWAVFYALIPMFFASNIGEWVIKTQGISRFNELTQRYEYIPNQKIFVVGALISTLSIIPIVIAKKHLNKKIISEAVNSSSAD